MPVLVQARAKNQGEAFAQRLLTLILLALPGLTALAMVSAPTLVGWYSTTTDPAELDLSVAWARFFLPQILFYGVLAMVGAILNQDNNKKLPDLARIVRFDAAREDRSTRQAPRTAGRGRRLRGPAQHPVRARS